MYFVFIVICILLNTWKIPNKYREGNYGPQPQENFSKHIELQDAWNQISILLHRCMSYFMHLSLYDEHLPILLKVFKIF